MVDGESQPRCPRQSDRKGVKCSSPTTQQIETEQVSDRYIFPERTNEAVNQESGLTSVDLRSPWIEHRTPSIHPLRSRFWNSTCVSLLVRKMSTFCRHHPFPCGRWRKEKGPQPFGLRALKLAGWTRLELATFCVTGVRPSFPCNHLQMRVTDLCQKLRPPQDPRRIYQIQSLATAWSIIHPERLRPLVISH